MKVSDLVNKFNLDIINMPEPDREVTGAYCGDLLSVVMSKAPADSVWLTVMNNVNVAAVIALADIAVAILCDVPDIDDTLIERVKEKNINLLRSKNDVYTIAKDLGL